MDERIDTVKALDDETRYNTELFKEFLIENRDYFYEKIAEQRIETPGLPSIVGIAATMSSDPEMFAAFLRRTFIDQGMEEEDHYDDDDSLDDAVQGISMAIGYMLAAIGFLQVYEAQAKPESNLPAPNADGIVILREHSPDAFFIQQEERARLN